MTCFFILFYKAVHTASTIHFAGARHSKEDPTVYNNVAGTSFKYYQHQKGVSFSEKLLCEGPITSDIFILVCFRGNCQSLIIHLELTCYLNIGPFKDKNNSKN